MKKNDVFTFTASNGAEVTGVVVAIISSSDYQQMSLCYAQNRLFCVLELKEINPETGEEKWCSFLHETYADYAILPDYDAMLDAYQHQTDTANDYADKTL